VRRCGWRDFQNLALSVGNLIGSNILDVLLPIGIAAVIVPISFDPGLLRFDLVSLLMLSLLVLGMLLKSRGIRRPQALLILLCYLGYLLSFTQRL
jgi:cation:H+ antiporter